MKAAPPTPEAEVTGTDHTYFVVSARDWAQSFCFTHARQLWLSPASALLHHHPCPQRALWSSLVETSEEKPGCSMVSFCRRLVADQDCPSDTSQRCTIPPWAQCSSQLQMHTINRANIPNFRSLAPGSEEKGRERDMRKERPIFPLCAQFIYKTGCSESGFEDIIHTEFFDSSDTKQSITKC